MLYKNSVGTFFLLFFAAYAPQPMSAYASSFEAQKPSEPIRQEEKSEAESRDEAASKLSTEDLVVLADTLSGKDFLGKSMFEGRESEIKYADAARLYKIAADRGSPEAQLSLGMLYYNGQGVEKNINEAVRLFQISADQGLLVAQYNLGLMFETGLVFNRNYDNAVKYYNLAAKQNYGPAQHNLALMYINGLGLPVDYREAIRLSRAAAANGIVESFVNLSSLYSKGFGVKRNIICSYIFASIAEQRGSKNGSEAIKYLNNTMYKIEIDAAKRSLEKYFIGEFRSCD